MKVEIVVCWRSRIINGNEKSTVDIIQYSEKTNCSHLAIPHLCTTIFSVTTDDEVCISAKYKPLESTDISILAVVEGGEKFCCTPKQNLRTFHAKK
ncbi:MAG: hypothetical protein Fur0023_12510 [Bacteroidia bacterium]